jgi:hypothetical protein
MSRLIIGCTLLGLSFAVPATLLAQKKKTGAEPATPKEYAQLLQVREIVGKLANADEGTRVLSFEIEYQVPAAANNKNPAYVNKGVDTKNLQQNAQALREMQQFNQQMARLAQQRQEAMRTDNPQQRAQKLQQVAMQMQRLQAQQAQRQWQKNARNLPGYNAKNTVAGIKMETVAKGFELDVQEKVVVRRQNLPFEYDDKGNPKQFTKEEVAELRGKDASLPGYKAKYGDLQQGQMVRLYLASPKAAAKNDDDAAGEGPRPQVRMIVILAESDGPALANPADKKKKKN